MLLDILASARLIISFIFNTGRIAAHRSPRTAFSGAPQLCCGVLFFWGNLYPAKSAKPMIVHNHIWRGKSATIESMFRNVDRLFLIVTTILVAFGFFIFASASLGLLAKEGGRFSGIFINQLVSLGIGVLAFLIVFRIKPTFWNKHAFFILLGGIVASLLVFVPFLGLEHGGARRWIDLGFFSFQPAEVLKFSLIIFYAAWCAGMRTKINTFRYGLLPLVILLACAGILLVLQPDYGSLIIISVGLSSIFLVGGGKWRHILALAVTGIITIVLVSLFVPYVKDRILTFLDPTRDPQGAGFQIEQSLIAVGSGGLTGRGFGQSVQKFTYLPEPIGDSIFAVFAEEWGFVGSVLLITLFVLFLSRGYRIANKAPTIFTRLVVVGFTTTIVAQSFINMGSMLNVMPLTGDPLVFVSQGGTSILFALIEIGIILRISSHGKAPLKEA